MKKVLLLVLLSIPTATVSAVEIVEIAWMGSANSANHEWIELYNPNAAVDVTGWQLSDGNNINVDLTGMIDSGAYVVLERTSDDTVAGSAFAIYTGALGNGGATLTLRDAGGQVVDQVVGGEDWTAVGGDNQTKETAQKNSGTWGTAVATPGSAAGNVTTVDDDPDDTTVTEPVNPTQTTSQTTVAKSNSSSGDAIVLTLPDITLQLDLDAPSFIHVNQATEFTVTPSGVGDTFVDSMEYTWNFGDGTVSAGQDVSHTYAHPGRYVVVVSGGYKRQQQVARVEINVLPVSLSLDTTTDGDYAVTNVDDTEINLSGYRLVGHDTFRFPDYSILLPGQTVIIVAQQVSTQQSPAMVVLYDQSGHPVDSSLPDMPGQQLTNQMIVTNPVTVSRNTGALVASSIPTPRSLATAPPVSIVSAPQPTQSTGGQFTFAANAQQTADTSAVAPLPGVTVAAAADEPTVGNVTDDGTAAPTQWPLYGLSLVLVLAIGGLLLVPSPQHSSRNVS